MRLGGKVLHNSSSEVDSSDLLAATWMRQQQDATSHDQMCGQCLKDTAYITGILFVGHVTAGLWTPVMCWSCIPPVMAPVLTWWRTPAMHAWMTGSHAMATTASLLQQDSLPRTRRWARMTQASAKLSSSHPPRPVLATFAVLLLAELLKAMTLLPCWCWQGQATTLKRNGSDFSATIMGALFKSGHITIWTDVDGVFSADPRKVPEAVCLPSMTYHEAWELSYFGANVLHPRTTLPAMKYQIPITIRNFFNLEAPGKQGGTIGVPTEQVLQIKRGVATDLCTGLQVEALLCTSPGTRVSDLASDEEVYQGKVTIKGFATIDQVTLISVEVGMHLPSCFNTQPHKTSQALYRHAM